MTSPASDARQGTYTTEAFEAAHYRLLQSITLGLQALKQPACIRAIGPVVPGATMAHGARVPGTSLALDPVQAAFSIGTMLHWLDEPDPSQGVARSRPAVALGGILAVADYLSRKAIAEGRPTFTVRDVLRSMLQAHSIQLIAAPPAVADAGSPDTVDLESVERVATAAVVTSLLGGTSQQVTNAVLSAQDCSQWVPRVGRTSTGIGFRRRWALGDATSSGVRIALLAVHEAQETPTIATPVAVAIVRALMLEGVGDGLTTTMFELSEPGARTIERFEVCVAAHFPPVQVRKIQTLFSDPARLASTAAQEFSSALVRN